MSEGWDGVRFDGGVVSGRSVVDLLTESMSTADVDYMPPVSPDKERTVTLPARLVAAVRAEMLADLDRARGERGLLAPPGSRTAVRAHAHETHWRALHPGFAEFLDWPFGGGS